VATQRHSCGRQHGHGDLHHQRAFALGARNVTVNTSNGPSTTVVCSGQPANSDADRDQSASGARGAGSGDPDGH
jgi:hypothetical protein